jgi:amino acid permease
MYDLAGDPENKEKLEVPKTEVFEFKQGRQWRLSIGSLDNCSDNY